MTESINNRDELMTYKEATQYLKVTRKTIYNYMKAKKIKAIKVGRTYRVTQEELNKYLTEGIKQ